MNFLKPTTVAGAVAPLLKVLSNLDGVVTANDRKIGANEDTIKRLQSDNVDADAERMAAHNIIKALGGIVYPDGSKEPARG